MNMIGHIRALTLAEAQDLCRELDELVDEGARRLKIALTSGDERDKREGAELVSENLPPNGNHRTGTGLKSRQ